MYSRTVLSPDELAQILDGIWAYNRLGEVGRVVFFAADGSPLAVESVEVWSGAPAIRVRSAPEEETPSTSTPEEAAANAAGAEILARLSGGKT